MIQLLIHADGAPEFVERPKLVGYHMEPAEDADSLIYESLGKVVVAIDQASYEEEYEIAECWTFAHPQIIERIREDGNRRMITP